MDFVAIIFLVNLICTASFVRKRVMWVMIPLVAIGFLYPGISPITALVYFRYTFYLFTNSFVDELSFNGIFLERVGAIIAHSFLVGGAVWLVAYSFGIPILGFSGVLSLLTANHFHAAGFGCMIIATRLSSLLHHKHHAKAQVMGWIAIVLFINFYIVAIGLTGSMLMQRIGTILYWLIFVVQFVFSFWLPLSSWRKWVLSASLLVPIFTLGLSYAWVYQNPALNIENMAHLHGLSNLILFLLPCAILTRKARGRGFSAWAIPMSRVSGTVRIGADIVHRAGWSTTERSPTGTVEDFSIFEGTTCHVPDISPTIKHFYEQTNEYSIFLNPNWPWYLRWISPIFQFCTKKIGQFGLPFALVRPQESHSEIIPIRDEADGRNNVRAWIRSYREHVLYVALYSTYRSQNHGYMNIALPILWGNISTVLHVHKFLDNGIKISSKGTGEEGIWFCHPRLRLRIPLEEELCMVEKAQDLNWDNPSFVTQQPDLVARHRFHFLGIPIVQLNYWIYHQSNV